MSIMAEYKKGRKVFISFLSNSFPVLCDGGSKDLKTVISNGFSSATSFYLGAKNAERILRHVLQISASKAQRCFCLVIAPKAPHNFVYWGEAAY
jgi:hypothetical protein